MVSFSGLEGSGRDPLDLGAPGIGGAQWRPSGRATVRVGYYAAGPQIELGAATLSAFLGS